MGYLLKNTAELRFETMDEVKNYQNIVRQDAMDRNYQLASYSWTEKEVTVQGEVIDSYFVVKCQCVFNVAKDPELNVTDVVFNFVEGEEDFSF